MPFATAREKKPSIILIDEIDSILSRSQVTDGDTKNNILNEFKVQWGSPQNSGVVVIGTKNKPWDIDESTIRRFDIRLEIPLPNSSAIESMILDFMESNKFFSVDASVLREIVEHCVVNEFSGADVKFSFRKAHARRFRVYSFFVISVVLCQRVLAKSVELSSLPKMNCISLVLFERTSWQVLSRM